MLMIDANQVWDVDRGDRLDDDAGRSEPVVDRGADQPRRRPRPRRDRAALEPLGSASRPASTCQNRVMFKQFLQAGAIDFCQIDTCRLGGVNEVLAVLLLAAKFGVPVCPHAGGVGLCEYVQHLVDLRLHRGDAARSRTGCVEYVDHLHEHFVDPVVVEGGRYRVPEAAGYSIEMKPASLAEYAFPDGPVWTALRAV